MQSSCCVSVMKLNAHARFPDAANVDCTCCHDCLHAHSVVASVTDDYLVLSFRQFRQIAACRAFAGNPGGTAGVGSSTKAPSSAGSERGGAAGSQHDEDIMSELRETQGKAGMWFQHHQRAEKLLIWHIHVLIVIHLSSGLNIKSPSCACG